VVVGRMYEGLIPFSSGKNLEKGYKDFLIAQSIREYFKPAPDKVYVVLLTANYQDFSNDSKKNEGGIIEFDKSFAMNFVSIAPSVAVLFQELSNNLKAKHNNDEIFSNSEEISKKIKDSLISDFTNFEHDILGGFLLNIELNELNCHLIEYAVVEDEDLEMMEISGIVRLEINCSFEVDEWDFVNIVEPQFVFSRDVNRFFEEKGYSRTDEWSKKFSNMKYCSDFVFNYIDFDFKHGTLSKDISFDFMSLSMSRI
jgi:hypothetical protein